MTRLPGQPELHAAQFSGYVHVNRGASLFYWLVEAVVDNKKKPLVLWLNRGPGCSSIGYGAFQELGPCLVSHIGTEKRTCCSWIRLPELGFLSPLTSSLDMETTPQRFPGYKRRAFYIAGESYAGYYIPSLAEIILKRNSGKTNPVMNLRGILMGNPALDRETELKGRALYFWSHGLISDDTYQGLSSTLCSSLKTYRLKACEPYFIIYLLKEAGNVNGFNVLRTECKKKEVSKYCLDWITTKYMNRKDVQQAFHAIPTAWTLCSKAIQQSYSLPAKEKSMLPTHSGATHSVGLANLDIQWRCRFNDSFHSNSDCYFQAASQEEGKMISGWSEIYEGITFVTIRGCSHEVPMYAPTQALKVSSTF
ncbi:serine carboxypeptidase-like 28 [Syzygium oleosum]|uniref:serine carboxypeptidase-like 28 n=1 Tax=Syzygium oleosum TaxID=219896 RepID=UPI0024BA81A3|nr:serine carboxypeptidase-like 28 [Syzygium oleosum]